MGEPAYHGISKMQVMYGVVSEGLRPCFPPNTPKWYCQLASACWRKDPRRRYPDHQWHSIMCTCHSMRGTLT